jgi:aminoglycoside phosphotransferase (APT) family kinase protein
VQEDRANERLSGIVARLAGCAPSQVEVGLRPPLDHQSNTLYDAWADGRHVIVKEYLRPEEFSTGPAHEHRALELLVPLDVAPQPVGIDQAHDAERGPIVIYEYLEGTMWDRRTPTPDELAALVEVWLRVHAVPADQVWESRTLSLSVAVRYASFRERLLAYQRWVETSYPAGADGAALCLEVLDRRWPQVEQLDHFGSLNPQRYFCRSDARFANVIGRPDGRIGLVDWEDSGLRDPARELSDMLYGPNQEDLLTLAQWRAFLDPYLAVQAGRDPNLPRRIELYRAIYPLFWLSILFRDGIRHAEAGTLESWTINGMPANQRLRRYLARALTWPDPEFGAQLDEIRGLELFPESPGSGV